MLVFAKQCLLHWNDMLQICAIINEKKKNIKKNVYTQNLKL